MNTGKSISINNKQNHRTPKQRTLHTPQSTQNSENRGVSSQSTKSDASRSVPSSRGRPLAQRNAVVHDQRPRRLSPSSEPKKDTVAERKVVEIQKENILSPTATETVEIKQPVQVKTPMQYGSLIRKESEEKYKIDSEYFSKLEKNPSNNNLCRDKRTKKIYFAHKSKDSSAFKQVVQLSNLYKSLGLPVVEVKLLSTAEGEYVLLMEQVRLTKPSEYLKTATEVQKSAFYDQVCKGFALDLLVKNTKVLEGDFDSDYVVTDKGIVVRSSMKTLEQFCDDMVYPVELWDLRDASKCAEVAKIWGKLDIAEISKQIITINKASNNLFSEFSEKEKSLANKRWTNLLIIANKTKSMRIDGWSIGYIDDINRHMVCLKKLGCKKALPKWLKADTRRNDEACRLRGPNGVLFEGLRGDNSVIEKILMPYVRDNEGNYQFIIDWMEGHTESGWSNMSQVLMYFLSLHREAPTRGHFWLEGINKAKSYYEERALTEGLSDAAKGEKVMYNSFIMLHAFTQIVLGRIDFPNNTVVLPEEGQVRFERTESMSVMRKYARGFKGNIDMTMAPYSSGSVVTDAPLVHGTEITERTIPHHRVIAVYFMLRELSTRYKGAFSNDFQNEFTAILGGINCNYIGTLSTS